MVENVVTRGKNVAGGILKLFKMGLIPLLIQGCGTAASATRVAAAGPAMPQFRSCSDGRAAAAPGAPRSLELHVRPLPADVGGAIAVRMVLAAPEAELWSLRPPVGLRQALEVRMSLRPSSCDPATGEPPVERKVLRVEPGAALPLGTGSASQEQVRVELEYQLDGVGNTLLNANRFLAEGRQLFFSPVSPAAGNIATLVDIDATSYGRDGRAASSIGLGSQRRAPMTQRAVDESIFAAGYLGSAEFLAPEGEDAAAWFGSPPFDPRSLAAEIAAFRSAVRERFHDLHYVPLMTIVSVESALSAFDVRRAPVSVVARVAPGQGLSGQLHISILHQVLKEWIGGRLTLVDETGTEAVWFTEGLCRYFARELAFEFGMISPLEYIEEVNGLVAIHSVFGEPERAPACAAEATLRGGAFSGCRNLLALARGALLAGELDRVLAARDTSLSDLLVGWLRAQAGVPLTPSTWASALQRDGGEAAANLLARFESGAAIVPPSSAFGPCFARVSLKLAESELGFEYESVDAAAGAARWVVTHVPDQSPAFATGLRPQTAISAIDFSPYAADQPVRVLLADGAQIEFRPRTHTLPGVVWKRVTGVPDRSCQKR